MMTWLFYGGLVLMMAGGGWVWLGMPGVPGLTFHRVPAPAATVVMVWAGCVLMLDWSGTVSALAGGTLEGIVMRANECLQAQPGNPVPCVVWGNLGVAWWMVAHGAWWVLYLQAAWRVAACIAGDLWGVE